MEPVKLGIIGCGVIGNGDHLPSATKSPLVELVAVADLIEGRVKAAEEKYSIPAAYNSGSELLEDDNVEAVVLAMPVRERTPLAYEALEKGRHVLLEKPVAHDVGEVEKMMALRGDRVVGDVEDHALGVHEGGGEGGSGERRERHAGLLPLSYPSSWKPPRSPGAGSGPRRSSGRRRSTRRATARSSRCSLRPRRSGHGSPSWRYGHGTEGGLREGVPTSRAELV